ncbi:MAG: DNA translocase FtsK [Lachnospiraceae bacterium]|nr:DNA translocase FtsK [Lachnospiraceae bacterium]
MAEKRKTSNTKNKKTSTKGKTKNVSVDAKVIDVAKMESIKEIVLWMMLAICVLLFVSNLGIGGVVGNAVSGFFFGVFGIVAYLFPILLLIGVFFAISNSGNRVAVVKLVAGIVFVILLSVLVELIAHGGNTSGGVQAFYFGRENKAGGGFIGGFLAKALVEGFGLISAYVITLVLLIICFILVTEKSLLHSAERARRNRRKSVDPNENRDARLARIEEDKARQQKAAAVSEGPRRNRKISGVAFDTSVSASEMPKELSSDELNEVHMSPDEQLNVKKVNRVSLSSKGEKKKPSRIISMATPDTPSEIMPQNTPAVTEAEEIPERQEQRRARKTAASTREMIDNANVVASEVVKERQKRTAKYAFPPLSLLTKKPAGSNPNSKEELEGTADKLEQTLRNFGINVEVTDVTCGPTVTRYELLPEVGVRVNRITNLADDIKLNLAVTDIRIEAPIPGKAAVGIEVPNKDKVMVSFEELAASKEFKASESKVTFCAGRDIAGNVITANIAKMPHLLIAGTTGSGKSVCINTIIMSILYKATPDEVKFIMIDPKVVELSIYNGIPHLLIPVVTEPKKAAGALHWAVMEMDDRYQKFADAGVRDIKSYNQKLVANNYKMPINSNGELGEFEKMPEMVVIVDELADLMMVAAKEVEESICRLAQKARAAGIYLILATQRPSVDVVTGLIKANMPSRIAFAVNSGVDSRTILDMFGAEKLLGNGDMLYYPQGYTKPLRVQGAFVSDSEVQKVVDYIKGNNENVVYDDKVTQLIDAGGDANTATGTIGGGSGFEETVDSYFPDAGRLIISKEKGSIGMLQRYFKIGFNRAARIMDQLEEAGVVGPEVGTKPRSVMMSEAEFEQYLNPNGPASATVEEEYPVSEDF